MKMNSTLFVSAVVAAICLGLASTAQAVPAPPVPDSGSTGLLLGGVASGLMFLKWKLKR
jgi:hypothetical protein